MEQADGQSIISVPDSLGAGRDSIPKYDLEVPLPDRLMFLAVAAPDTAATDEFITAEVLGEVPPDCYEMKEVEPQVFQLAGHAMTLKQKISIQCIMRGPGYGPQIVNLWMWVVPDAYPVEFEALLSASACLHLGLFQHWATWATSRPAL